MNALENLGRRMPYDLPEEQFEAMQERIRLHTTGRPLRRFARRGWIAATTVAVAAAVVAGVFVTGRQPEPKLEQSLQQMLSTASSETLQRAAAENYDDILVNQQL